MPEGGRITADRLLLDTPGGGERQPGSAWLTAGSATATSEGRRIAARIRASGDWFQLRAVLSVNGALVLVLGLLPGGLMALCANAIVKMLTT